MPVAYHHRYHYVRIHYTGFIICPVTREAYCSFCVCVVIVLF